MGLRTRTSGRGVGSSAGNAKRRAAIRRAAARAVEPLESRQYMTAVVADAGFEAVSVGTGYQYNPGGSAWAFAGQAGLTGNGSAFTAYNPAAPQGSQAAFVQDAGSVTQSPSSWAAGTYQLSFAAAQRGGDNHGGQDLSVLVDGNVVGTFRPSGGTYQSYTTGAFTVAAGTHSVEFLGLDTAGGDNTALVDNVQLATAASPAVADGGFEWAGVGSGGFQYAPADSAWTFAGGSPNGSGVTGNGSGFTAYNPSAPEGTQAAFIEGTGTLSQSVDGWAAGSYQLTFAAAQRGGDNHGGQDFQVLVDGSVAGKFKPSGGTYQTFTTAAFTVAAGSHTVEFLGLNSAGGDNTALLDDVQVAAAASPAVADPGFEWAGQPSPAFAYNPAGGAWTFAGQAGVTSNGSDFTAYNPSAPQGGQAAFVQGTGSISQSVDNWSAGAYQISFSAAQRGGDNNGGQDVQVLVDGNVVGTFRPQASGYLTYTTPAFTVAAGSHTVEFLGLDTAGGDNTALVDGVQVGQAAVLADAGFEAARVGPGAFQYAPTGSAWTFAGGSPSGSGLTGNGSTFTAYNPAAPQGSQAAFVQGTGSITQSVDHWAAGNYQLTFAAAQRGGDNHGGQDFAVLVDGNVVGTYEPDGASYQTFTTPAFAVAAGTHAVRFLGLDSAGGDNTAFVDDVQLATSYVTAGWSSLSSPTALGSVRLDAGGNAAIAGTGAIAQDRENYAFFGQSSDTYGMAYQALGTNQQLVAQVTGQQDTDGLAKAGLMIRGSTDADAAFVGLFATPAWGVVLMTRTAAGAYVESPVYDGSYNDQAGPVWLKLTTQPVTVGGVAENLYTAYASLDGSTWGQVGQVTVAASAMGASPLACVAVDANGNLSGDNAQTSAATFAHVSVGALAATAAAPEIPYNIGAQAFSGADGRVVWQPLVGASTVTVQQSTDGGATFQNVATVPATYDTFLPNDLLPNTTYEYRLVAHNANGDSPASPAVSLTTTGKLAHAYYQPSLGPTVGADTMAITESSAPVAADSPQQALLLNASGSTTSSVDGKTFQVGGFTSVTGGYAGHSFSTQLVATPNTNQVTAFSNNSGGEVEAPAGQLDGSKTGNVPQVYQDICEVCPLCCQEFVDYLNSFDPVSYSTGSPIFSIGDLTSAGFTGGWSIDREYTTQTATLADNAYGYGWSNSSQSFLLDQGPGAGGSANPDIALVSTAYRAMSFAYDATAGAYGATGVDPDRITHDAASGTYTWFDPKTGGSHVFYDFSSSTPAALQGKLKSMSDAGGNPVTLGYNAAGQLTTVTQADAAGDTELFAYAYSTSGPNAGQISSIQQSLQRAGASAPSIYRQAVYSYYQGTYAGGDAYGNQGDLKSVVVEDGSGSAISTDYYRYYTPADIAAGQTGYVGAIKYALTPTSFAKLSTAAGGTPFTASDALVATCADNFFQYDAEGQATEEVAGAAGASAAGGDGTDTLAYATNPNYSDAGTVDYNAWMTRATEDEPDGTRKVVYSNVNGDPLVAITTSGSTVEVHGFQYDPDGRLTAKLDPSAMDSAYYASADAATFEAYGDVGLAEGGARAHAGLVETTTYYDANTATATAAGGATDFTEAEYVQQGLDGTPVEQDGYTYIASTNAAGLTAYYAASTTQYRNDDGTGAETTTASYTYYAGTNQPSTETDTAPTVTAAEDGPGAADVTETVFDTYGHAVWTKDARGFINYVGYDIATGAAVQMIQDVDTSNLFDLVNDTVPLPTGWATPAGGGLNLVTSMEVDDLGRTTKMTSPGGNVTYTVYDDPDHEVRVYAGWNATTGTTTGPIGVYREDWAGSYTETLTTSDAPAVSGSAGNYVPTGTEAITAAHIQSLSRSLLDATGQTVESDSYFNLSGLTYSTASFHLGAAGTNYYVTSYAYDAGGRQFQTTSANGTITQALYDGFGNALSTWVGASASNLTDVADYTYDVDNNLLTTTTHPGGTAADRVTTDAYDYRDRPILETVGAGSAQPIVTATTYDNLDEATEVRQYAGSGFTANADNTPTSADASLLRAEMTMAYDEQGQLFSTSVLGVDPTTGDLTGGAQVTKDYYDGDGDVIASQSASGLWTKATYDGVGRATATYQTDGLGGTSYADASTVAGDVVLSQARYAYDGDSNVIETITSDRSANDSTTATGALGGSGSAARVSYMGSYYDALDRLTASVDVGTNGGSAWTRPATVPTRSGTVLVTSYAYDAAGEQAYVTDPAGLVTAYGYDALGRTLVTVANWTDTMGPVAVGSLPTPTDSTNQTTEYTYDGDNNVTSMTAVMPSATPSQTTHYVYGVTTANGSGIDDNDLLYQTEYPDPTTGAASASQAETYAYDAAGEETTYTDRNGTAHGYSYDALGRLTADTVTHFATGVDQSVAKLGYTYTDDGQLATSTSYDASGAVVNETSDTYDGFGNLASEAQAVSGAVSVTTPTVGYTTDPTTGRMTSMTYPDGRTLNYNYASGLDADISRLTSISDAGGTIQSYGYQGLATPMTATNGNGVTATTMLDDLGRVASLTYTDASNTVIDGQAYTYDQDSNILSRRNLVHADQSELYTYDGLNRLVTFSRGTLNGAGTAITGTPSTTESWNMDAVGNWNGNTLNGATTSRTNSAQNQVKTVGAATLTYDANGNTLTDNTGQQYVYDAWNRLVTVKDASGTTIAAYTYNAQGRRVTETHGTATTDLYYTANWQLIEERDAATGTPTKQYVWSPFYVDQLVERDDHDPATTGTALNRRLYAQQDADYNVTSLTDASGAVVERYVYDPYGNVTVLSPDGTVRGTGSDYGWIVLRQGLRLDVATNTYDERERVYLVNLGRFAQNDPAGFVDGPNTYQVDLSSPVSNTDAAGLSVAPEDRPQDPSGNSQYNLNGRYTGSGSSDPWANAPSTPAGGVSAGDIATGIGSFLPGVGNYIALSGDIYHGHYVWAVVDVAAILADECGAGEVEAAGRTAVNIAEDVEKAKVAAKAAEDAEKAKNAEKAAQDAKTTCPPPEKTCFVAGTFVLVREGDQPPVAASTSVPWSHRWGAAGTVAIVIGSLGYFVMAEVDRRRRRSSGHAPRPLMRELAVWIRREQRRRSRLAGRAQTLSRGPFRMLRLDPR